MLNPPFRMLERVSFYNMIMDGGDNYGGGFNPPATIPAGVTLPAAGTRFLTEMIYLEACYEWYWGNVRWVNCAGPALKGKEYFDNRFEDMRIAFCGNQAGTLPAVWGQSGPTLAPGFDTVNNNYFTRVVFESCPGVLARFEGTSQVDNWFIACKAEAVNNLDNLVQISEGNSINFDPHCWMYAAGAGYNNLSWTDTTTTTTLATGSKTFALPAAISYTVPTVGASTIFANMHLVVINQNDPRQWASGRVTSYNQGTGALVINLDDISTATTMTSSTSWKVAPMHPGLISINGLSQSTVKAVCSYPATGVAGVGAPYLKCMVQTNNSVGINHDLQVVIGGRFLPEYSFMAYSDATTTNTVGTGSKSFNIGANQPITVGETIMAFGATYANAQNQMIGRVTAYNSATGDLTMYSDRFNGFGISISNWTLAKPGAQYVRVTGTSREHRFAGGHQTYGNPPGIRMSNNPSVLEQMQFQGYGTPEMIQRNLYTMEEWRMGRVILDPTLVGANTVDTGKFQFLVKDIARSNVDTIIFDVDGARTMNMTAPLGFKDVSTGRVRIRGSATASPTTGYFEVGDIVYNSVPTSGVPMGWQCITASSADGTTTPAVFRAMAPLNVSNSTGTVSIGGTTSANVAGKNIGTGTNNIAIGGGALGAGTAGSLTSNGNVVIGVNSANLLAGGSAATNVIVGPNSGTAMTTGSSNVLIGSGTATALSTSTGQNVIIGSGQATTLTTGNNNIIISTPGNVAEPPAASSSLVVNIGNLLKGSTNPAGNIRHLEVNGGLGVKRTPITTTGSSTVDTYITNVKKSSTATITVSGPTSNRYDGMLWVVQDEDSTASAQYPIAINTGDGLRIGSSGTTDYITIPGGTQSYVWSSTADSNAGAWIYVADSNSIPLNSIRISTTSTTQNVWDRSVGMDASAGAITYTLVTTGIKVGQEVEITNIGTANNVTISGANINGVGTAKTCAPNAGYRLRYFGATYGWRVVGAW